MRPQIAKEDLVVPTADVVTNVYAMDVIGNKADAAQDTVAADKSLMGYTKAVLTDTGTTIPGTITTLNTAVVTDIPATITTLQGNVTTVLGGAEQNVATASINLSVGNTNIFTVTGLVEIVSLIGTIDTTFKVIANNTKITAGGGVVDICGVVDITGAAQFSIFSIDGVLANAMIINVGGAFVSQAGRITVGPGAITVNCAGDDAATGLVTWYLLYKPVSSTGSVVAA